ncbi:MAG: 1-deoxy-D-xylulose-5-phosphate reductoisomerase [Planctomycetaceae bacterium]
MKRIAVLGATGSIGTNCLEVAARHQDRMRVAALTAHRNWRLLAEQSRRFRPRFAVVSDAERQGEVDRGAFPAGTELLFGPEAVERVASDEGVDVVVAAIVGAAGLRGTWAALETGKTIALANKETLVVAGALARSLAERTGATLLPVDSEHSAVFQALRSGRIEEVKRIVLTASGGPFRGWTADQLESVTPEMALAHPTWNMGRKITVDSATMMNKALEVIEAKWLFDLDPERIEVVVHPQSVVHSFVEFIDGSVIAQLSPPDMKLPIQYALTWPERVEGLSPTIDWREAMSFTFEPPDRDAFPALDLGFETARRGGSCGAVLNAANEAAVERFLTGELRFVDIPRACRAVLEAHDFDPEPSLAELLRHDARARREMARWNS